MSGPKHLAHKDVRNHVCLVQTPTNVIPLGFKSTDHLLIVKNNHNQMFWPLHADLFGMFPHFFLINIGILPLSSLRFNQLPMLHANSSNNFFPCFNVLLYVLFNLFVAMSHQLKSDPAFIFPCSSSSRLCYQS